MSPGSFGMAHKHTWKPVWYWVSQSPVSSSLSLIACKTTPAVAFSATAGMKPMGALSLVSHSKYAYVKLWHGECVTEAPLLDWRPHLYCGTYSLQVKDSSKRVSSSPRSSAAAFVRSCAASSICWALAACVLRRAYGSQYSGSLCIPYLIRTRRHCRHRRCSCR